MVQSGDDITYFSREPKVIFIHQQADQIIYLQNFPPPQKIYWPLILT